MEFPIRVNLAGMTFNNRMKNIKHCHWQSQFVLDREPDNEYDPNAIMVRVPVRSGKKLLQLGYIPRDKAEQIAPMMDDGVQFECKFVSIIVDGDGIKRGLIVKIEEKELYTNDEKSENIFA